MGMGTRDNQRAKDAFSSKMLLVRSLRTDPVSLARLALVENKLVSALALQNPKVPAELLIAMVKPDAEQHVLNSAANNICAPAELIRELYGIAKERPDPNQKRQLLISIAHNRNTPVDLLQELAESGNVRFAAAVVMNPTAPDSIVRYFMYDRKVKITIEKIMDQASNTLGFEGQVRDYSESPYFFSFERHVYKLAAEGLMRITDMEGKEASERIGSALSGLDTPMSEAIQALDSSCVRFRNDNLRAVKSGGWVYWKERWRKRRAEEIVDTIESELSARIENGHKNLMVSATLFLNAVITHMPDRTDALETFMESLVENQGKRIANLGAQLGAAQSWYSIGSLTKRFAQECKMEEGIMRATMEKFGLNDFILRHKDDAE
jgi:hypothetical protein